MGISQFIETVVIHHIKSIYKQDYPLKFNLMLVLKSSEFTIVPGKINGTFRPMSYVHLYSMHRYVRCPRIITPGWIMMPSINITHSYEEIREMAHTASPQKGSVSFES